MESAADIARALGIVSLPAGQGEPGRLWVPQWHQPGGKPPDALVPATNAPQRVLTLAQATAAPKTGLYGGSGWQVPANGTLLVAGLLLSAAQWQVTVDGGITWATAGPVQAVSQWGPPVAVPVLQGDRVDVSASVSCQVRSLRVQFVPSALAGAPMQGVVAYGPDGDPLPTDSSSGALQTALVGRSAQPYGADLLDASGSITTANTAQQVLPADSSRAYVFVANPNATDTYWLSWVGDAAANAKGSFALTPLSAYESGGVVATNALSILAPTAGDVFTCNYA